MGNLITFRVSKKDLLGVSETEVGDIGPDDDRASVFAESVMKGLSLEGGATLLLAAAWVTSEGRLCDDMFGEAMGFDITMGSNAEKRPLARATLTAPDGKNVPFFNSFLPSQCAWVFHWLFMRAFPTLFPVVDGSFEKALSKKALEEVRVVMRARRGGSRGGG